MAVNRGRRPTHSGRHQWLPYLVAVIGCGIFASLLGSLGFEFGSLINVFLIPVILSAYLGGLLPGLTAIALAVLFSAFFLLSPRFALSVSDPIDKLRLTGVVINGVLISLVCEALLRSRERVAVRARRLREYEKVVEGLDEMIVVIDREYRYVIANHAFLKHRGLTSEELMGRRIFDVLGSGVFEKVVRAKVDECFLGRVVKYEMNYTYPELGERDLFISYFPIEGPAGVDRAACVLQDVTEHKRAEEDMRTPIFLVVLLWSLHARLHRQNFSRWGHGHG